jgi:hypothetical protein
LKILLKRYPLPFYYEFDSCVNIIEEKSVDNVDNILNLKFNLNNDVHNLPKLLESFILNLQSRKVDTFKKGIRENFINKDDLHFQRSAKLVKELLNALNPILNKNDYLDRADSLISTLAMLIYIDEIFDNLFVDEKLIKNWQDYNVTIIQHSYLKHESIVDYLKISRDKRNEEISKVKKVKYSEFVKKLMSVFELRHDSLTAVYLKREGKNVIEVTLKENNFIEVIDVESLRKSINRMIKNAFTNDEEKAKTDQSLDSFGLGISLQWRFRVALQDRYLKISAFEVRLNFFYSEKRLHLYLIPPQKINYKFNYKSKDIQMKRLFVLAPCLMGLWTGSVLAQDCISLKRNAGNTHSKHKK